MVANALAGTRCDRRSQRLADEQSDEGRTGRGGEIKKKTGIHYRVFLSASLPVCVLSKWRERETCGYLSLFLLVFLSCSSLSPFSLRLFKWTERGRKRWEERREGEKHVHRTVLRHADRQTCYRLKGTSHFDVFKCRFALKDICFAR